MTEPVSGPDSTGRPVPAWRRRAARIAAAASTLALAVPVAVLAQTQGSGNRHFTAAPSAQPEEEAGDVILGVPANTIFFVAVAVIGVLWFTVGGGRKAKLDRQQ